MSDTDRSTILVRWAAAYRVESARPLASLALIAPLLVTYEAGMRILGAQAARNGADAWMRRVLEWLDFDQYFLLPVLTVCILLAWHYTTRQPWRVSRGVLSAMAVESVLMAIGLRGLLYAQSVAWQALGRSLAADGPSGRTLEIGGAAGRLIGFLGAGVYEELLFRLILLSLAVWVVGRLGLKGWRGAAAAVLLTSATFALAHYVGRYGEPWAPREMWFWFGFFFRLMAGVFFSVLFLCRGFGIAAGAHAGYDILVGVW